MAPIFLWVTVVFVPSWVYSLGHSPSANAMAAEPDVKARLLSSRQVTVLIPVSSSGIACQRVISSHIAITSVGSRRLGYWAARSVGLAYGCGTILGSD
ncbi:MAG: hypothetical protein ACYSQZ_06095, partial [Planctomycetota bacterium]